MLPYRVADWMSTPAIVIPSTTPLTVAHEIMEQRRIRRLPVVDDTRLVGIITRSDLLSAMPSTATTLSVFELGGFLERVPVAECMTRNPITVAPSASVLAAVQLLLQHQIGGLPVVADERLIGVITESDLFRVLVAMLTDQEPTDRRAAVVCHHCGAVLRGRSPETIGPDDTCWQCHYHLHRCDNCRYFDRVSCLLARKEQHEPVPGQHCPLFAYLPPETITASALAVAQV